MLSEEPKPLNLGAGLEVKEVRPGVHCFNEADLEAANIAGDFNCTINVFLKKNLGFVAR